MISIWIGLLLLGFTFLAWPGMGTSIQSRTGDTPRDFFSAFYYAGGSMTRVGSGDLSPVASFFKCLNILDPVIGVSVLTLACTYLIQIYTALQRRNTFVLTLHHASGVTGEAAVLLAKLGCGDDFHNSSSQLAEFAVEMTGTYESHHFYSVLIYSSNHGATEKTAAGLH